MLPCCLILAIIFVSYWTLEKKLEAADNWVLEKLHLIAFFEGSFEDMEKWQFYYGKETLNGPETIKHKRKAWICYFIVVFLGLLPWLYKGATAFKIFGAGMIMPGGGFFAMGIVWAGILTLVIFGISLFAWWGTGNQVALNVVWALAAIIAYLVGLKYNGDLHLIPVVVLPAIYFLIGRVTSIIYKKLCFKRQAKINEVMPEKLAKLDSVATPTPSPEELELSDEALAAQAYIFDQAFAPYGEFRGFTVVEQFSTDAVRYQINSMLNSLQMVQCHYTPNYHGPNTEAQRKLIELFQHKKVWSYWEWEEAWGNLSRSADPIPKRGNVMLTGFFLVNLTMYMRNTGDMRYEKRGSIAFRKNEDTVFNHSAHTIAESIVGNWDEGGYTVFPCEPNFLYSLCNWKAIQSMVSYDKLFGTTYWDDYKEKVLVKFRDELIYPDGVAILFRSTRTGWCIPPISATYADVATYMGYLSACPEWTKAFWALKRDDFLVEKNGKKDLAPGLGFDHGNFSIHQLDNYSGLMIMAAEEGDTELAEICREKLFEKGNYTVTGEGFMRWKTSNEVNAQMLMALAGFKDAWRSALVDGPKKETFEGPLLVDVDYTKVWVAKAISLDGKGLNLVLKNSLDRFAGTYEIGLERLVPGQTYTIKEYGTQFTADAEGKIRLAIPLNGRTKVTIAPVM